MQRRLIRGLAAALIVSWLPIASADQPAGHPLSHAPLRKVPPPSNRPLGDGPFYCVDAKLGDDKNAGTKAAPWRTIGHALKRLKPHDTLYLRGGTYYENLYIAVHGKPDGPITIRSHPGEQAIIDGGFREFFESPLDAWVMVAGGKGEWRSKKSYPNLREVLGSFGDSMIGLQTYYHAQDFHATNELVDWEDWANTDKCDLKSLYLGPGLWYNRATGNIHVRLAHTHMPAPVDNYRGETDPRLLPLVISHYHAAPLHLDQAKHLRFQDLVIRGAGYAAVKLEQTFDIEFDNVTIWCGTYGLQAMGAQKLKLFRCGLYGSLAPWTFRNDASKRDYPGRPHRNISRMNTHALVEIDAGRESSVYATPFNDDWDISYCDFTDAHDGLYLGAINVQFHHNLLENLQDDGLYLSPMYPRHALEKTPPKQFIHQNVFRQLLTALAFGGPELVTKDTAYIYRNVIDLRGSVNTGRPSTKNPKPGFSSGKAMGDHGSPPWPAMMIYHNTFVMGESSRDAAMATTAGTKAAHPRKVFNNIYLHLAKLPGFIGPDSALNAVADGNLYWSPDTKAAQATAYFNKFRASKLFEGSKLVYAAGSSSNDLVADPLFVKAAPDPLVENDYRLQAKSPALGAGVPIPADWPDPLRSSNAKPGAGALGQKEAMPVGRLAKG